MEKFGRYILLERIAVGGMGEIFVAKLDAPAGFNKYVVVKRMLPTANAGREAVQMFFAEARMQAAISHANLAQVYEMGTVDGIHFIVIEYIQGVSLRALQRRAAELETVIPLANIIEIIMGVCRGLGYAHEAKNAQGEPLNIVHRDVSPENILLGFNGDVKVIDFGVAKSNLNELKTETGTIKGKMAYMAPEQAMGEGDDSRVDVFAVGVCLLELLLGQNPFMGRTMAHTFDNVLKCNPPMPSSVNPDFAPLDLVCSKALEKDLQGRYPSLHAFAKDLGGIADSITTLESSEELSALLKRLFGDSIQKQQTELKSLEIQLSSASLLRRAQEPEQAQTVITPVPPRVSTAEISLSSSDIVFTDSKKSRFSFLLYQLAALFVVALLAASAFLGYHYFMAPAEDSLAPGPKNAQQLPQEKPVTPPSAENLRLETEKPRPEAKRNTPGSRPKKRKIPIKKKEVVQAPAETPKKVEIQAPPRPILRLNSYPQVRWQLGAKVLKQKQLSLKADSGLLVFTDQKEELRATVRFEVLGQEIRLRVSSQPWSLVFFNGKSRGRSPATLSLGSGNQTIELRRPGVKNPLKIKLEQLN